MLCLPYIYALLIAFFGTISDNIKPGQPWYDTDKNLINAHGGGILYKNGIYYWYGEFKGDSTYLYDRVKSWECYRADTRGISCYSSKDLTNWKFEGVVLSPEPEDPTSDLHPSQVLERPKVIYNSTSKKYVMWFHVDSPDYSKACVGVATCDIPNGKFSYLGSFRPDNNESRDMSLFQDNNEKAYLIYSSEGNNTMHISLLTDDYLKPSGKFTRIFINAQREAPAILKNNGKYYIITSGCSGWDPNEALYATADSMLGEWTMKTNPCHGKDANKTYYGQSTWIMPIAGKEGCFIAMFDRWNKKNLKESSYLWLPLIFKKNEPHIKWTNEWNLQKL